ncbi:MAG: flippase-like domain-containing protein [Patescibacteria group bacterium]|nr:flippase-like domain-containing protein [Patescibacteria group bacterium]
MAKNAKSSGRLAIRILANTALGLLLIFIWSRFVNLSQVLQILSGVDLKLVLPIVFFIIFSGFLRGGRLKLLLARYHLPLKDSVMITYLSQFLSFLIPVRAGELTKSVYLSAQFELNIGQSLIWVLIDRFLDFWVVLLLIVLFIFTITTSLGLQTSLVILGLFVILTLIFVLAIYSNKLLKFLFNLLIKLVFIKKVQVWLTNLFDSVIEGFELLKRKPQDLLLIVGLTIMATASDSLVWFFTYQALGHQLSLGITVVGNCLAALTFLIPSAPGYVGTTEAATLAVFSGVLGLPANLASAAAVLFHILTLVALPAVGIISLYLLKFDLKLVWNKLKRS